MASEFSFIMFNFEFDCEGLMNMQRMKISNIRANNLEKFDKASIEEFSSTVIIGYFDRYFKLPPKYICSGTVLTSSHVLTLSSCLPRTESKLYVFGGYETLGDNLYFGRHEILSVIRYNEWARESQLQEEKYNLAIVTLSKPDPIIRPAQISPMSIKSWHGVKGRVIGYRPSENEKGLERLNRITVKILPKPICASHVQKEDLASGKIFCTESPPNLVDGDKGGPFFDKDNQLFGINLKKHCQSYGKGVECTNLHINIHHFKDFIVKNTGKNPVTFPSPAVSHIPLHAKSK
ncbi:hypothetical protein QAD02_006108 [Eretmocerus hayati]|uniref:Uncharacterized protein n=1 Tax=Eretmocerus hayati TaxID=131215 RepID=A0ACC2N0F1_9HYME|nr:hypothetical protein QAD02_006108 [Eretmocerus hayati]